MKDFSETEPTGLYEDAIGDTNVNYYVDKFEDFDQQGPGLKISWNWAAFFGGGAWALYRKMYWWFVAWWFVATVVTVFAKIPNAQIHQVLMVAVGALWLCFSIFANSLYHRQVKSRIVAAQKSNSDASRVRGYLGAKGGVHVWGPIVFAGIPALGIVAAVALPAYQDYTKRQASAESKPWEQYQEKKGASASSDERPWENDKPAEPAPTLVPFYGKTDEELARDRVKKSAFDWKQWSGNAFDRFDTVGGIELRARQFPSLNELRAWAAVIAWQAYYMADGKKPANEALYAAVGTVLEGFNDNKGVCRPGRVVIVDAASASDAFPVGTVMTLHECDR